MTLRPLAEYVLNSLWQLPLLTAITWLVLRLARPTLALQHAFWLLTLALAILLPLRGLTTQDLNPQTDVSVQRPVPESVAANAAQVRTPSVFAPPTIGFTLSDRAVRWFLSVYALSLAISLARLLYGYAAVRRLVASAVAQPLTVLEATLMRQIANHLNLATDRIPEVRFLDDPTATPLVAGIRRPLLLLPQSLRHTSSESFDDHQLAAILSHELTHVRRHDFAANLLARAVSIPIAYHPAAGFVHARIRQTREMLCDADAADTFHSSAIYARSLLAIAARLTQSAPNPEAIGLFDPNPRTTAQHLEERIVNLIQTPLQPSLMARVARLTAGAALLTAGIVATSVLHLQPKAPTVYAATLLEPVALTVSDAPQAVTSAPAAQEAVAASAAPAPRLSPQKAVGTQSDQLQQQAPVATPSPSLTPMPEPLPTIHVVSPRSSGAQPLPTSFLMAVPRATEQIPVVVIDDLRTDPRIVINDSSVPPLDLDQQMAKLRAQLDSAKFRAQMQSIQRDAASKAFDGKEFKDQMERMRQQLNSPEFRKQIEAAKQQSFAARSDARKQLDEARAQIDEARKSTADPKIQMQLDEARRHIDKASKTF
jgi:beta-lactamase regulating signal transducer with metallopeptidase domain